MADLRLPGLSLELPDGITARALEGGDPSDRDAIARFTSSSPDRTLYHGAPYFRFARSQRTRPGIRHADLVLFSRDGHPLFALPVHPQGRAVATEYSGVLFPSGGNERTLRRSVEALAELFAANRRLRFTCVQAALSPGFEDAARQTLLERLLAGCDLPLQRTYSRIVGVSEWADAPTVLPRHASGDPHGAVSVPSDALDGAQLSSYDSDVRNQIRQALRKGVEIRFFVCDDEQTRAAAYERFAPMHRSSWERTGMQPHDLDYWTKFSTAISDGGGHDLVVIASTTEAGPVAAVTFHLYEDRALYWAGVSLDVGQRLRANPLCLHAAMTVSAALGTRSVELGRFLAREPSPKERAITSYKAQFGGELARVLDFSSPVRHRDRLNVISRRAAHSALQLLRSRG